MVVDPLLDVAPPEAEVPADPESWGTLVPVAPGVDGGYRYGEILGEFTGGEQLIAPVHWPMMRSNPFKPMAIVVNRKLEGS